MNLICKNCKNDVIEKDSMFKCSDDDCVYGLFFALDECGMPDFVNKVLCDNWEADK